MKKNIHNYFLSLGMVAVAAIPIVSVVSCNKPKPKEDSSEAQAAIDEKKRKEALAKKGEEDALFLKPFKDAGAIIKGKTKISVLGKTAKSFEVFKKVLLLSGAKKAHDKKYTSGIAEITQEGLKALYDFWQKPENINASLYEGLIAVSWKEGERSRNFKGGLGYTLKAFGNSTDKFTSSNFVLGRKEFRDTIKAKMEKDLKAKIDDKNTKINVGEIAAASKTVDEFGQGLILLGAKASDDYHSSSGISSLQYGELEKIYNFYKKAENKDKSLSNVLGQVKNDADAFPKERFVIITDEEKNAKKAAEKAYNDKIENAKTTFKDVIGKADGGKTSAWSIAKKAADVESFKFGLIAAGAKNDRKDGIQGQHSKGGLKSFGTKDIKNLFDYLKAQSNEIKLFKALSQMEETYKGKKQKYKAKFVGYFKTAFSKDKFITE